MPRYSFCKHHPLDVPADPHQVFHAVPVVDPLDILLDDRPGIQLLGHIVGRGTDQLDPTLIGLDIGTGTGECRQETVVDVDDTAWITGDEIGGQDLHVAGKYDGIDLIRQ